MNSTIAKLADEFEKMQLVSYQLSTDDLKDGNTVKLPREEEVTV